MSRGKFLIQFRQTIHDKSLNGNNLVNEAASEGHFLFLFMSDEELWWLLINGEQIKGVEVNNLPAQKFLNDLKCHALS